MNTFRVMGVLLSYPEPGWLSHLGELRSVIEEEGLLKARHRKAVLGFIDGLSNEEPLVLQERYVATFDRGRAHSLHLFEHIHGESRDRGQAMVDLAAAYAEKGLTISQAELPDYLPLFLEFLSCCTVAEAVEMLGQPVEVIAAIGQRLGNKGSPFAPLFGALVALSRVTPRAEWLGELLDATPVEDSLEALDQEWEEAAAFSSPSAEPGCQGCPSHKHGSHVKTL